MARQPLAMSGCAHHQPWNFTNLNTTTMEQEALTEDTSANLTAVDTVLATTELLERIPHFLPIPEIIKKKRVCKAWLDCIRCSVDMQWKPFLLPTQDARAPKVRHFGNFKTQPVALNPLPGNMFCIRHSQISGSYIELKPKGQRKLQHISHGENLLKRNPTSKAHIDGIAGRPIILGGKVHYRPGANRERALPEHSASPRPYSMKAWADMLATQPPVKRLCIVDLRSDLHLPRASEVISSTGEGITLGELATAAAEWYRKQDSSPDRFNRALAVYQPLDVIDKKNLLPPDLRTALSQIGVDEQFDEFGYYRTWNTMLKINLAL
jgi:hypothetical protein